MLQNWLRAASWGVGQLAAAARAADGPVTLRDEPGAYVSDNGLVTARIDKRSADVVSLKYKGLEFLTAGEGRAFAYWSLPGTTLTFGNQHVGVVRTDPASNAGERATVSIKFTYDGGQNTAAADVDIIYSLARGDSALYLMANWVHKPEYPVLTFGPGGFAAKLNPAVFDYMTIDAQRARVMATPEDWAKGEVMNMKEAKRFTTGLYKGQVKHKYDYCAIQFDTPAYGWSSTKEHVGLWLVTASNEYMSGGPTKFELNAHLDGNIAGWPTLLNVWKGPHYGGTTLYVVPGQAWTKAIGPFMLYCNSAQTQEGMWKDALAKAAAGAKEWPYSWVNEPTIYTPREQRATVSGQMVLNDTLVKQSQMSHLLVGLAAPDWNARGGAGGNEDGAGSGPGMITWQRDSEYYQFWVRGDAGGKFVIPNVRPGKYTLHAIADGVLGEYAKKEVTVEAGKPLDLGSLTWTPVRYGKQVWDIGIPNRFASEFYKGDDYFHWGMYIEYSRLFPNDVHYVIGKSDYRKDWYFEQVPHCTDPNATIATANGKEPGRATTWSITYNLPAAPKGKATLRLAICGVGARSIAVGLNDKPVGSVTGLVYDQVVNRDGIGGYWQERDLVFDAAAMKAGDNVLTLTIPGGGLANGILYDYLRLEVDENGVAGQ